MNCVYSNAYYRVISKSSGSGRDIQHIKDLGLSSCQSSCCKHVFASVSLTNGCATSKSSSAMERLWVAAGRSCVLLVCGCPGSCSQSGQGGCQTILQQLRLSCLLVYASCDCMHDVCGCLGTSLEIVFALAHLCRALPTESHIMLTLPHHWKSAQDRGIHIYM